MKTIREWRQEHEWTQFELAIRVGVRPQTVYFWESGRRTPQVTQIRKLGQLFGICSDEINLDVMQSMPAESVGDPQPAPVLVEDEVPEVDWAIPKTAAIPEE